MRQWLIVVLLGGTVGCGNGTDAPRHRVLRLVHDSTCTLTPPDGPGVTEITFLNSTNRAQGASLVRLADSTADSTVISWYTGSDSIPPTGAEWIGGPGPTLPGRSSAITLHLSAGRYLALCLPAETDSGARGAPPMASFAVDSLPLLPGQEPPLTDAILQIGPDSVTWIPTPAPGRRIVRIANQRSGTVTVSLSWIDEAGRVEILGGISELGAGREGWTTVVFRPGRHEVTVSGGARNTPGVVTEFVIE